MNIRRLAILVVLIVAGFWYVTTFGIPGVQELPRLAHRELPLLTHKVQLNPSVELTEADAQSSYDNVEQNNISVYRRVLPAVVNITSTAVAYDWFWGAVPQQGQGSGFIVDSHGHILTNYHVIEGGRQIEVTLANKHKYKAQVVLTDRPHDLALLQIDAPDLTPVRAGLVPRLLARWGLVGYALLMAGSVAELAGIHVGLALSVPGGLFEVALGIRLLTHGFDR